MPKIENILRSITSMSDDEVLSFIREAREDRRITKKIRKSGRPVGRTTKEQAARAIAGISPSDMEELMKRYGMDEPDSLGG